MDNIELKGHNLQTYKEIKNLIKTEGKGAIVQATGTGKSSIIAKIIEDYRANRAILLAPSGDILNQFKEYNEGIFEKVELMTYAKLNGIIKNCENDREIIDMLGNVKLIVADELHRIGAEKWGESFKRLTQVYNNAYIIGATATPVRVLENRDMVEEVFGGKSAGNIGLRKAIEMGIISKPTYIASLYSIEEEIETRVKNINTNRYINKREIKDRLGNIKLDWENNLDVDKILKQHLSEKIKQNKGIKVITFCTDVQSLNKFKRKVTEWFNSAFPEVKNRIYVYHLKEGQNKKQFEEFKEVEIEGQISVLMVINKLNEGVHIDDIGAIIMLRKTTSNIIYYQQIGRILSIGSCDSKPIIFDLVNNCKEVAFSLKMFNSLNRVRGRNYNGKYINKHVEIYDYVRDLNELLKEVDERLNIEPLHVLNKVEKAINSGERINNLKDINLRKIVRYYVYNRNNDGSSKEFREVAQKFIDMGYRIERSQVWWTDEEDEIIKKYYDTEGKRVLERLENRTLNALHSRAKTLGLTGTSKRWTEKEDETIRTFYPKEGAKTSKRLPGRSNNSVVGRASKLGVKKEVEENIEEKEILRKYYPSEGYTVINRLENKNINSIKYRVGEMGLKKDSIKKWTDEEEEIIRKYYPTEGYSVKKRLKNKSISSIRNKARLMGVSYNSYNEEWTEEEDSILRKYYSTEGTGLVNRLNNRTKTAIKARVQKLGIKYDFGTVDWSKEEEEILKHYYHIEGIKVIERLPSKDKMSIKARAKRLGLRHRTLWTEEEDEIIKKYYKEEGSRVTERLKGRTKDAVRSRAKKIGITESKKTESSYK